MENIKVALIHDYLLQHGGAEKTFEAIAELFPNAPVYTGAYKSKAFGDEISKRKIHYPNNFLFSKITKFLSPIMPSVFENFDLSEYDLIISDSSCWAKGVLTKPDQLHVSYIHTPPRFLYKYSVESTKRNKWYFKPAVVVIDTFLRAWDFAAAQRPNFLIANSQEIQKRIKKYYQRDSVVIYPPVDIPANIPAPSVENKEYFLALGRLVAYKNFDVLIKAFNNSQFNLVIAGTGPEEENLKNLAGPNVTFTGRASEEKKSELLANCLGVINPVEDEDFGVVPIEAMAYGKPVLAHKSGGHLETIVEGESGKFFTHNNPESLAKDIEIFYQEIKLQTFDGIKIAKNVQKYSKQRFQQEFKTFIDDKLKTCLEKDA